MCFDNKRTVLRRCGFLIKMCGDGYEVLRDLQWTDWRPFHFFVCYSGISRYFMLILCGDVSLNPGPVQCPCTVCEKCVRSNQRALLCDECELWSHANCVGIKADVYNKLKEKMDFSMQCPSCLFSVLPNVDVIDNPLPTISDTNSPCLLPLADEALCTTFTGIRVAHHNIQGVHSKMDDLATWFNLCMGKNVIFCFTEIWTKPNSPPLHYPGYQVLLSPYHVRPGTKDSFLPGSCIFISNSLFMERNSRCVEIEESCKLLNVTCCVVTCKHYSLAIVSAYRSPSIS